MLNVIIFLVGALIMFYMALRSVRARQQLRTKGVCVQATVSGTVQSRDGAAYVLEFTTAGGSHRLQYPKPAKGKPFAEGSVVTLYYDPDAPEKMFVEGDKSVLGAELLYTGIGAALLVLMTMLVCAVAWASGDIDWDTPAAGQNLSGNAAVEMLKDYIRRVNETLISSGAGKIDPCYELYPTFASLGLNGAEFAQHAEITVNMNATGITSLVLRMDNLTSFALIGGALVQQTSPNSITLDEAVSAVQAYVRKVQESNGNGVVESFEEQPILSQGTQTRLYGAYYPNQYHDNANWMQLTIIFPQPGSVDGGLLLNNDAGPTATPDPDGDEISGYFPFDGFQDSHLEVFVTPTPEPDSAAMEP